MTIEDIKNLKDKIYEIEGLLELAQLREDKIDELAPLIEERLKCLAGAAEPTEATEPAEAAVATEPAEVSEPMTIEELFEESQSISITHDMSPADSSDNSDNSDNSDSIKSSDVSAHSAAAHSAPRAGGASKPAFTLNDRFRFRRELFNNSDAEFSEAMGRIALMDSYDEAEEHFIDELGWDAENPEVADFMEIIRIYFEG